MLDKPSNMPFVWDDDNVRVLRRLWREGKSASEIAAALPGDVSRSAVIGKAHRLKLSRRSTVNPKDTARLRVERSAPKAEPPAFETAPLPEEQPRDDVSNLLGIMDLKADSCRYMFGDPKGQHGYCGRTAKGNSSWCEEHYAVVFKVQL